MNKKNIIVFDFETSSVDHRIADIFQIAALAVDGLKLEVIPNSYFNAWMKPDGFDEPGYYEKFKSTIDWHAKNFNCTPNDFMEKIKNSPPEKLVWEQFTKYLSNYHDRQNNQSFHSSPIPAGFNIINYDMRILERFCTKYKNVQKDGSQSLFYMRDVRDVLHMASLWLSPLNELK